QPKVLMKTFLVAVLRGDATGADGRSSGAVMRRTCVKRMLTADAVRADDECWQGQGASLVRKNSKVSPNCSPGNVDCQSDSKMPGWISYPSACGCKIAAAWSSAAAKSPRARCTCCCARRPRSR